MKWKALHGPWSGQWAFDHSRRLEVYHWTLGIKRAGVRNHAHPHFESHVLILPNWDDRDIRSMLEDYIEA